MPSTGGFSIRGAMDGCIASRQSDDMIIEWSLNRSRSPHHYTFCQKIEMEVRGVMPVAMHLVGMCIAEDIT